jgi:hypothetical protein
MNAWITSTTKSGRTSQLSRTKRVGIAFQAVLVTDSVIHMGMVWPVAWRVADVALDLQFSNGELHT